MGVDVIHTHRNTNKFINVLQNATGQLANNARLKQVRRDIARIKTITNEDKGKQA